MAGSTLFTIQPKTCVDLEVCAQVAGVAEGLAAVFTLVSLHPHVAHEMHLELGAGGEGSCSAALELPGPGVAAVSVAGDGSSSGCGVSVDIGQVAALGVAGPRGGGGARCPVG